MRLAVPVRNLVWVNFRFPPILTFLLPAYSSENLQFRVWPTNFHDVLCHRLPMIPGMICIPVLVAMTLNNTAVRSNRQERVQTKMKRYVTALANQTVTPAF